MKTHQELGITAEEHEALQRTIAVLEAEDRALNFDMSTQGNTRDEEGDEVEIRSPIPLCNTHACIGGTMSLLMQNTMALPNVVTPEMAAVMSEYVDDQSVVFRPLHELFWGNTEPDVTPSEGVKAIRQFLDGNTDDPWGMGV